MKTLFNPWFILFSMIWAILYIFRISGYPIKFFSGHLTDFLAIPVLANLGLWFQRVFVVKRSTYILKVGHVIFIVVYVSVVFEWLLPKYHPGKFTGDWTDVLLYILGGFFFFKWMNKPSPKNANF